MRGLFLIALCISCFGSMHCMKQVTFKEPENSHNETKQFLPGLRYLWKNRSQEIKGFSLVIALEALALAKCSSPAISLLINLPISYLLVRSWEHEGQIHQQFEQMWKNRDLAISTTKEDILLAIKKGGDPNGLYDFEDHQAIYLPLAKGRIDIATLLSAKGADLEKRDNQNRTVLLALVSEAKQYASESPAIFKGIEWLLKNGARINEKNTFYETAVHIACGKKNLALLELLAKYKASLEEQDARGNTPLHICAQRAFCEGAKFLLSRNVNIHRVNNNFTLPIDLAAQADSAEIVYHLAMHGAATHVTDFTTGGPATGKIAELCKKYQETEDYSSSN